MAKKAEEKTSREITDLTTEQEKVDAILAAIASLKRKCSRQILNPHL